jgi:hypothetical protein
MRNRIQKSIAVCLLVVAMGMPVWPAGAQTAGTNEIIPLLALTTGPNYTNAMIYRVTPAYAVVAYDGGLAKVALSNMPAAYQEKYRYDPAQAAAFLTDESRKQHASQAAETARQITAQAALVALRGTNQTIHVLAVLDDQFGYLKCRVATDSGSQTILLNNLPVPVKSFVSKLNQMRLDTEDFQDKVKMDTRAAERADALVPNVNGGDRDYVELVVRPQRIRANLMLLDAKDEAETLQEMESSLSSLELEASQKNAVVAFPTGQNYAGFDIWEAVGTNRGAGQGG